MKLQQIINNFITDSTNTHSIDTYSIDTYIKQVNLLTLDEVNEVYTILDTTFLDQRMHAIILLWLLKYKMIDLNTETRSPYLSYLRDLIDEEPIQSVKFLSISSYSIVARVITDQSHIYVLMNNSNDEITFTVPSGIANQVVYCFNCNDDMKLGLSLDIPEYSFYALKKSI